ncbi:MAG TPA: hypothetical protein VH186_38520 [Chloroflexia bacterium]|nr:hypothetical protein [Chloroflexia bacterium]
MAEKKILRFSCPVCETRLRLASDIERFACLNCGTELEVAKEEGVARLVPSKLTTAQMTNAQQQLIEVNSALKSADDAYGVGCAVATMGIALGSCAFLGLSVFLQSQVLFFVTILVALVLLGGVLFMFITASSRNADPLIRQRDRLQQEVEQETENSDIAEDNLPNSHNGDSHETRPQGA